MRVTARFLRAILVTGAVGLTCMGCDLFWLAQTREVPQGPSLIYVLPEGFSGWACVDFGVATGTPLEQEGTSLVIRPTLGVVLQASNSSKDLLYATTQGAFEEGVGGRRALPLEAHRSSTTETDSNDPVARHCEFFGSQEYIERAGDAPKLIRGLSEAGTCPVPKGP